MFSLIKLLCNGLEKSSLKEMADRRNVVTERIESHRKSMSEHFIKLFTMKNDLYNYDDYVNTVSAILDLCNRSLVKGQIKLKQKEYLELLFGITNSFSVADADCRLNDFWVKHHNEYKMCPYVPGKDNEKLVKCYHDCYQDFAEYFSGIMATDKKGATRLDEFKKTLITSFIENPKYDWEQ